MGLNDHMLNFGGPDEASFENLQPTLPKRDGVSSVEGDNAPNAIIRANGADGEPAETTNLNQTEIDQIGKWNTQIEIVDKHGATLVDMKAVQKDIEGNNSIDARDADEVNTTFEGLFTPRNPRGYYTHARSQAQYGHTCEFMCDKIRLTTESLLTDFREIEASGVASLKEHMRIIREENFPDMTSRIYQCFGRAENFVTMLSPDGGRPTIIIPIEGGEFVNMVDGDIGCVDFNKATSVPFTDEFLVAMEKLQTLWCECVPIRKFLSMNRFEADGAVGEVPVMNLTNIAYIFFCRSKTVEDILKFMDYNGETIENSLDRFQVEATNCVDDAQKVQDFLGSNGEEIKANIRALQAYKAIASALADAYEAAATVLEGVTKVFVTK